MGGAPVDATSASMLADVAADATRASVWTLGTIAGTSLVAVVLLATGLIAHSLIGSPRRRQDTLVGRGPRA